MSIPTEAIVDKTTSHSQGTTQASGWRRSVTRSLISCLLGHKTCNSQTELCQREILHMSGKVDHPFMMLPTRELHHWSSDHSPDNLVSNMISFCRCCCKYSTFPPVVSKASLPLDVPNEPRQNYFGRPTSAT